MVNGPGTANHPSAPKSTVKVGKAPAVPVLCGYKRCADVTQLNGLPPINLDPPFTDRREHASKPFGHTEKTLWKMRAECFQRSFVEMVIMTMSNKHRVDGRHLIDREGDGRMALHHPHHISENGIDEKMQTIDSDQEAAVSDP